MKRIALIILGLWLAITLASAAIAGITLARDSVTAGDLTRSAAPRVLFGPGRSTVRLDFAPDASACPTIPLSIFLLLDKSGSMVDNDAFDRAGEAAAAFIGGVDLTNSSVAVAFFDDDVYFVQPATHDPAALAAALNQGISPGGGTNITEALQLAADNLGSDQSVIILLTDGVDEDPAGALAAAQALKSAGSHIVTVAVGPATDANFLRELASTPSAAFTSDDPAELQAIYTTIAEQLSSVVATNLTLTETVNETLTIDPETINPPATLDNRRLVWRTSFVPDSGAPYTYNVAADRFGWRSITTEAAAMSFIDCQADLISLSLDAGPRILVLPGPAYWLPWLLALLVPVFLLFRGRKPTPTPVPSLFGAAATPPPAPSPYPAWLRRLDSADKILGVAGLAEESGDLTPTIIVGLGPVGRIVLSQVAQALDGRFNDRARLPVRLLQVDVQPMTGDAPERPDYLLPDEWIILRPDYPEIGRALRESPEHWAHMNWYEPTAGQGYGRARGRMAVFYDLRNGADSSILYRGLRRAAGEVEKKITRPEQGKPRLRVVGSTFDDVSSGMLVDIAWLIWLVTRRNVDVELWLTGPVGRDWSSRLDDPERLVSSADQRARTLATLREIERFQRNAIVPLHYVPRSMNQAEFHQDVDSAVVQTLFLFEPPPGETSVDDHLATLTDSLLALLNPSVQKQVSNQLVEFHAQAYSLVNSAGYGVVCGIGAYAIATPQAPLREALTWRLVHDLLCEARVGLHPSRELTSTGDYQPFNPEKAVGSAVERRAEVDAFINDHRRQLNLSVFPSLVATRVADMLNGEGRDSALAHAGGVRRAHKWVEMLRNLLNQEGSSEAAAPLADLLKELKHWDDFLDRELCPAAGKRLSTAQTHLKELAAQGGRSWSLDKELEWPAYETNIRSWLEKPTASTGEPVARGAQRFGWQLTYEPVGGRWQMELWVPPGDFVWVGQALQPGELVVKRDADAILERLYRLVAPLAHNATQKQDALTRAARMAARQWLQSAQPHLRLQTMEVTEHLAGQTRTRTLLAAPGIQAAGDIKDALNATGDIQDVTLCAIEDRTAVTLLQVHDRVPLVATHLYNAAAWNANSVSSGLHVWRGEQISVAREAGHRFGSRFVGFLELDEALVDLYARAVLFGLLDEDRGKLSLIGARGWTWPGASAGKGLHNLFSTDAALKPETLNHPATRAEAFAAVERSIAQTRAIIEGPDGPGLDAFRREAERVLRDEPRSFYESESGGPIQEAIEFGLRPLVNAANRDKRSDDNDLRFYILHILNTL